MCYAVALLCLLTAAVAHRDFDDAAVLRELDLLLGLLRAAQLENMADRLARGLVSVQTPTTHRHNHPLPFFIVLFFAVCVHHHTLHKHSLDA
jgi:hypothetical protein